MIGDVGEPGDTDPVEEDVADKDVSEKDIDLTVEDVIDDGSTAEIRVDALVAKIDSEDAEELARQGEIRRKLEALDEGGDDEFGSTYNFNLDDDL